MIRHDDDDSPSLIEYVSWTDYGWLPCICFDHFVNAI